MPEFGYRFTYVYPGWESVDYVINCRSSPPRTPMVAKTVSLVDSTGYYTQFIAAESAARRATSARRTSQGTS